MLTQFFCRIGLSLMAQKNRTHGACLFDCFRCLHWRWHACCCMWPGLVVSVRAKFVHVVPLLEEA
jgi:hypothetical protein